MLGKTFFSGAVVPGLYYCTVFHYPNYSSLYLEKLLYLLAATPDFGFPVILSDRTVKVLTMGLAFFMVYQRPVQVQINKSEKQHPDFWRVLQAFSA